MCPPMPNELTDIQDEIVETCNANGLPLALIVISDLLRKVKGTKENWRSVVDSFEVGATIDEDDKCMQILALSYNHLPSHLKPCFLYMGMFPKDYMVPVEKLLQLWAAEGFLQPNRSESLEMLAEECLEDLVKKNLISVSSRSSLGNIKKCKIHDVFRKICLYEAQKKKFFFVIKDEDDVRKMDLKSFLRLSIQKSHHTILKASELPRSTAHSVLCIKSNFTYQEDNPLCNYLYYKQLLVLDLLAIHFVGFPREILNLVTLRYLAVSFMGTLPQYISRLQNLVTIVHHDTNSHGSSLLPAIRNLQHLYVPGSTLSGPPAGSGSIASTLQTLVEVINLSFGFHVLGRIRSLKKLGVSYDVEDRSFKGWSRHELKNLAHLSLLEKLKLQVVNLPALSTVSCPLDLAFPPSLKRLTLRGCRIPWEHLTTVGKLPNLEVLKLKHNACQGSKWKPMEEQFGKLRSLLLERIDDLVDWGAEDTHFPRLQFLIIKSCGKLKKIPLEIGYIQTLEKIVLVSCHPSIVASAEDIREDQEQYDGISDLEICVS